MIIVTAADHRFAKEVKHLTRRCQTLGYQSLVFDLGGLGFGLPAKIVDPVFQEKGYYKTMDEESQWRSRAIHKPNIIKRALQKHESIAYLDADAFPIAKFDEVEERQHELGVTVRPDTEEYGKIGKINAGVLFAKRKALPLIEKWEHLTQSIGNDQLALQQIAKEHSVSKFSTLIYNYYYFPEKPGPEVKILHFKSTQEIRSQYLNYAMRL